MKWIKFILWGIGYSFAIVCIIEFAWFLITLFEPLPTVLEKPLYITGIILGFPLSFFVHASGKYKSYKQTREKIENKPKPEEPTPDKF